MIAPAHLADVTGAIQHTGNAVDVGGNLTIGHIVVCLSDVLQDVHKGIVAHLIMGVNV